MDRQRGINSIHNIIIIVFARVAAIGHPSRRRCTLTTNPQTRQQWFGIPSWQVNYWLVNGMVGTTSVEGVLFLLSTAGKFLCSPAVEPRLSDGYRPLEPRECRYICATYAAL